MRKRNLRFHTGMLCTVSGQYACRFGRIYLGQVTMVEGHPFPPRRGYRGVHYVLTDRTRHRRTAR